MKCKKCGHKLRVIKTEEIGNAVYRVRQCEKCSALLKTSELNPQKEIFDETGRNVVNLQNSETDR